MQTFWVKVPLAAKAEATANKARRTKAFFMMKLLSFRTFPEDRVCSILLEMSLER